MHTPRPVLVLAVLALALALLAPGPARAEDLLIITEQSPPHGYTLDGSEFGELRGKSVDIVREVQKRVGDASPIRVMPWARAWYMATNAPNTMIFNTVRTPEREGLLKWAGPVSSNTWVFFARKGDRTRLRTLEEAMRARAVGVYQDDARHLFLKERGFVNLDVATSPELALRRLLSGRTDLWASDLIEGQEVSREIRESPEKIEVVFDIRKADSYLAFSLDVPDQTVAAWQAALEAMRADGTLARIEAWWAKNWDQERARLIRK